MPCATPTSTATPTCACSRSKMAQLEAMLPMQSTVVQLPFENSASGFDLFSEGATALVPELTGFSGVDVIKCRRAPGTAAGHAGGGATRPWRPATATSTTPTATFSVTSLLAHVGHDDLRSTGGTDEHRRRLRDGQVHQPAGYAGHRRRPGRPRSRSSAAR